MFPKQFISTDQLKFAQLMELFEFAARAKRSNWKEYATTLSGRVAGLLFFNPSLRTRASFQSGLARLGAQAVVLNSGSELWQIEFKDGALMNGDKAEHVREVAKVVSSYFDLIGVRSFAQLKSWEEDQEDNVMRAFQQFLTKPLINMESALWHPCQALADGLTLWEEFGTKIKGKKFVLSWANHPKALPMAVPNSALLIAAQLGFDVSLTCPPGYELSEPVLQSAREFCRVSGANFEIVHSQAQAFKGASVIYTKSWTPPALVGREEQERALRSQFPAWITDAKLMGLTEQAIFMHCLPARRNVVVSDEVIDSKQSRIEQQAANRMHAQNALLLKMLE